MITNLDFKVNAIHREYIIYYGWMEVGYNKYTKYSDDGQIGPHTAMTAMLLQVKWNLDQKFFTIRTTTKIESLPYNLDDYRQSINEMKKRSNHG